GTPPGIAREQRCSTAGSARARLVACFGRWRPEPLFGESRLSLRPAESRCRSPDLRAIPEAGKLPLVRRPLGFPILYGEIRRQTHGCFGLQTAVRRHPRAALQF